MRHCAPACGSLSALLSTVGSGGRGVAVAVGTAVGIGVAKGLGIGVAVALLMRTPVVVLATVTVSVGCRRNVVVAFVGTVAVLVNGVVVASVLDSVTEISAVASKVGEIDVDVVVVVMVVVDTADGIATTAGKATVAGGP